MKNMLSFAVDRGYLDSNPLAGFSLLPEEVIPLDIMTLEEERHLIECVSKQSFVIGAYSAVLRETGLRKSEGLAMQWLIHGVDIHTVKHYLGQSQAD